MTQHNDQSSKENLKDVNRQQMTHFQETLLAWIVFFGGTACFYAIDFVLRLAKGKQPQGYDADGVPIIELARSGLPSEIVYWVAPIALFSISLFYLYRGSAAFRNHIVRFLLVAIQVVLGFVIHQIVSLLYIIATHVDAI